MTPLKTWPKISLLPIILILAAALGFELAGQEDGADQEVISLEHSLTKLVAKTRDQVVIIGSAGEKRLLESDRRDLFHHPETGDIGGRRALGVGVLISPDGLVMTHSAVVPFADPSIFLITSKGRFQGRLLLRDAAAETVLIKVEAAKARFPYARISKQERLASGQLILAYGNPFHSGLDGQASASLGVIAARTRVRARARAQEGPVYIVDAAVNPGCYGAPVFDLDGGLVALLAPLLYSERSKSILRCAIPAGPALTRLKTKLSGASPPYLGLLLDPAQPGLVVGLVRPGSPADKAGLRSGDRIRAAAGSALAKPEDLATILKTKNAGDIIVLDIERAGQSRSISLRLGRRP